MNINKEKLKASLYGLAIGDALGVPYEFKPRDSFKATTLIGGGTWSQPVGTWSDDTSMTLASYHALKENNWKVNTTLFKKHFLLWYYTECYTTHTNLFDIGGTTEQALLLGRGLSDFYSNGNGSLMRISPLIFADCTKEEIEKVSAITHAHETSKQACTIYVGIGKELLKGKKLLNILKENSYPNPFEQLNIVENLKRNEIKSSSYVVDSLIAAIWSLINTDNYKDAILTAVNLGEDTDSIAAITGALAGIIYSYEEIPKEWIDKIPNKEILNEALI